MMRFTVKLKKYGFFIVAIVLFFIVNYAACFPNITTSKRAYWPRLDVCKNKACIDTAFTLIKSMNQSVKPCDDFYQYTCGHFIKNTVIPDDKVSVSFLTDLADEVRKKLKSSIENEITDKDPMTFKKLQGYYKACLNETQIEKNSKGEFLEILEKLGGWPLLTGESWNETNFDWINSMHEFQKEGYSSTRFMSYGVLSDMKNNSKNVIYLDQPPMSFSKEILIQGTKHKIVKAYYEFMLTVAQIFGVNATSAVKDLKDSLDFEIELAKIVESSSQRRDPYALYNPVVVKELRTKYPDIPFIEFLNGLMAPKDSLRDDDVVVITAPAYFESLPALLAKTPKRVQANYAFWQLVLSSLSQLGAQIGRANRNFRAVVTGSKSKTPRWMTCIKEVDSTLYLATGALYVRRYFDKETKDGALEMIENLRSAFRGMLEKVDWMDNQTKSAAIDKLNKILPLVAYPDELLNDTTLDSYYEDLRVDPDSYFKTVRSTNAFFAKFAFKQLRERVNKSDWTGLYGAATVVNAFYSPTANIISFPSGILQGSFFNKDLPKYVNYARLGSVVGHEMTHGFDNLGRLFDGDGNKVDWWDLKTKEEFLKRADCMIKQYSNYTYKEANVTVNGLITQGENIADNGGLKEAYLAYEAWVAKNGEEPLLPWFEKFTTRQLFWIANVNQWCIKYRPVYLKSLVQRDSHTPNEYRAIGMLSNSLEFARDFNCPLGSRMNPVTKCKVW